MIDDLFHFYKSGTEPFRTLSILSEEDAIQIMRDLYVAGAVFWERFEDRLNICGCANKSKATSVRYSLPKEGNLRRPVRFI